jgi:hypothetical protein
MGFFGKLKANFNHGGVKVQMTAPNTVSESDPSFVVQVAITNGGDAPQSIVSVRASLVEDRSIDSENTDNSTMKNKEVSSCEDTNSFTLQPGETKQLNMTIPLNIGKAVASMLPENGALGAAAKILGGIQQVVDSQSNANVKHYVEVVADVENITFDASARANIQVLKPGEFGASFQHKL